MKQKHEMKIEDIFTDLPQLETENLTLRKMTLDDAEDIFAFCQDVQVFEFLGGRPHAHLEETRNFIKTITEKYERKEGIFWGLFHKKHGKLIGDCGFIYWRRDQKRAELDYLLSRKYWNQALMTEAVKEIIRFGFENMDLDRIEAICEPANIASARVMEKAGMQFEGVLRNYIQHGGKPLDMKMHSIIRKDWSIS